ncbi:MAG: hypothetical protein ABL952_00945 [Pyrinomonadaceae bacterium]
MSCLAALIWCSILVPKAAMQERDIETEQMPQVVSDTNTTKPTDDLLAPQVSQLDITGPAGSGQFGTAVAVLPNGNIVVTDPLYDAPGPISNVGAVYLYNGTTGTLISTLTGSTANDQVGDGGVTVLTNGNFVVRSSNWDGAAVDVGAVTLGSGTTGIFGVISPANSLVGSAVNDQIGSSGVTALTNGNYVVRSSVWDGAATNVGAVTFGNGTTGITGVVSSANSLVGGTANDQVGNYLPTALPNGNYVVISRNWDSPSPLKSDVGAVTWGNGSTGTVGLITAANSLVGGTADDLAGSDGVTALTNGNYVVRSTSWDNPSPLKTDVGAVTWGNGAGGTVGVITASNSLVGGTANDVTGSDGVTALTNGNYVVSSRYWDNPSPVKTDVGAVTWGNGVTGTVGVVTVANSLIGGTAGDTVGLAGVTALTNGNYVASHGFWDNPSPLKTDVGAVTWGNGVTGTVGVVTVANSLIGGTAGDTVGLNGVTTLSNGNYVVGSPSWAGVGAATWCNGATGRVGSISSSNSLVGVRFDDGVGSHVYALTNGNYVVASYFWDNPSPLKTDVGAVTWGNGTTGTVGAVTASNSLIGGTANDRIGLAGVTALTNGNYVVRSDTWNNPSPLIANVGAVTWGNGATSTAGVVTASNSLVGGSFNDSVGGGFGDVVALSNGNYVVANASWDNPSPLKADVGAVTWGNGTGGTVGLVAAANSLIGGTASDIVGNSGVTVLTNGNYVVRSTSWDGVAVNSGAVSYGAGNGGTTGAITSNNSVRGTSANFGINMSSGLDTLNETLVVKRPNDNIVTIFNPTYTSVANGNWTAAATWDYGAFTKKHDVVIPSPRSVTLDTNIVANSVTINSGGMLTLSADRSSASPITNNGILDLSLGRLGMTTNLLTIGCNALINGVSVNTFVIGSIRKDFCTTGSYTYPTGTVNGYSPVTANVTALATNPSGLTVRATQTPQPLVNQSNSLKRFWTLTESGDLTANLTFNYLDPTDILGTESSYRLFRVANGNLTAVTPFTLATGPNTIATNGVTDFSDWAVGNLIPLATISGRVLTSGGRGVRNATVTMTDPLNVTRQAITGPFGAYQFANVPTDVQYTFGVTSRRFSFAPQGFRVMNNYGGLNFVSSP